MDLLQLQKVNGDNLGYPYALLYIYSVLFHWPKQVVHRPQDVRSMRIYHYSEILYRSFVFGRYQLQMLVCTGKTAPLLPVTRLCPDGQNCYRRADQGLQKADFSPRYTSIRSHKLQITVIYLWLCAVLSHSSSHSKRPSEVEYPGGT